LTLNGLHCVISQKTRVFKRRIVRILKREVKRNTGKRTKKKINENGDEITRV
jgi:hypothetical protein